MLYPDSCNKRRDAQLCIHLRMLCTWQGITRKIRDAFAYYVVMRYRVYHAYYNYVLSLRRTMKVRHLRTLSTLHTRPHHSIRLSSVYYVLFPIIRRTIRRTFPLWLGCSSCSIFIYAWSASCRGHVGGVGRVSRVCLSRQNLCTVL